MADIIVFKTTESYAIMRPAPDSALSTQQTGQKDVPPGVAFWIIDDTALPADEVDAWELTLGEASGTGGTYHVT